MSLFMVDSREHSGLTSTSPGDVSGYASSNSILDLCTSVDRVAKEYELLKMSQVADLTWIVGELKMVLIHWGDTEILNAVTKERVQHLMSALSDKIKEG